jgi:hypothetical protein
MASEEQDETRSINPARRQDAPGDTDGAEQKPDPATEEQGRGGHQDQALNPLKSGGIPE